MGPAMEILMRNIMDMTITLPPVPDQDASNAYVFMTTLENGVKRASAPQPSIPKFGPNHYMWLPKLAKM